jgi:integrase
LDCVLLADVGDRLAAWQPVQDREAGQGRTGSPVSAGTGDLDAVGRQPEVGPADPASLPGDARRLPSQQIQGEGRLRPGREGRRSPPPRGGIFNDRSYLKVFHQARTAAFSGQEAASLLASRPYDLRHAAVSTWLNAGVPAPQVADWAGHSVDVLLRVYAKCISGQQYEAKRRIEEATRPRDNE